MKPRINMPIHQILIFPFYTSRKVSESMTTDLYNYTVNKLLLVFVLQ
jgi:hypothetical protein